MNIAEAKAECQRWLDYLKRQEEKAVAWQKLASDRRMGKCSDEEMRRRRDSLDRHPTVYDGARLAEAVRFLMKHVSKR